MSKLTLKEYASAKNLPIELLHSCGITDSWNGINIPYNNEDDSTVLVKTRHTLIREKGRSQFSYEKDKKDDSLIPLGLNRLSKSSDTVFILEGETDYLTLLNAGYNCLGIPGATLFNNQFIKYIKDFKNVIIVVHNDKAGQQFESSIKKALSSSAMETIVTSISFTEYGNDANDCWSKIRNIDFFREIVQAKIDSAYPSLPKETRFDDDVIIVNPTSIFISRTKHSEKGSVTSSLLPVADFVVQITGQKVIFDNDGSISSRLLTIKATGQNWVNNFEISNEQLSSIPKFQEVIERQLGTKAKTYRRLSYPIIKAVALSLGSTSESVYVDTPGFQDEAYIYGTFKIDSTGIHQSNRRLVQRSNIASLDSLDFSPIKRTEASALLREYIEHTELAYKHEAIVCGIIIPALTILRNSKVPHVSAVPTFIELVADQGKGKTELHKNIASFFGSTPEDKDFNKPSDSFASIEEVISRHSAAGFKVNDFKGTAGNQPVRDLAERAQNWADGVPYQKFRNDKVNVSKPLKGILSFNGQDRLSAYLSSLASRATTFEIEALGLRSSFEALVSLRDKLNGITPHIIFDYFYTKEGPAFLTSRFRHYQNLFSEILTAEFSVERMIKTAALNNVALEMMWKFAYGSETDIRLKTHQNTLQNVHLRQVNYVREADLVHQLINALVGGLKSGVIFLGKERPSHCNAGAISVGRLPNFDDNKVWINPQPLLTFIQGSKSNQEIAKIGQGMITRELNNRGILFSTKSRATTRFEKDGSLGWLLRLEKVTELEMCLKELAGIYIPSDDGDE